MSSSFLSPLRRPLALLGLVAVAALSACGGNASRVEPYVPTRGVVFGDENSLVSDTAGGTTGNGVKYGVNYVDATAGPQCAVYPVWSQYVLNGVGLVLAECNPTSPPKTPNVSMRAAYQARVAQVQAQVTAYTAATAFEPKTLVTMMAGMWDIQDQYLLVQGGKSITQAVTDIQAVGVQLGNLINSITNRGNGARVIYSHVPDQGLAPCPGNPGTTSVPTCTERAAILTQLTDAFNNAMGSTVPDNGYWAALVQANTRVRQMANLTNNFGLADTTSPACTTALPNCTNNTLTAGPPAALGTGNAVVYLWADNLHLGPSAQAQIGALALDRAINNPF